MIEQISYLNGLSVGRNNSNVREFKLVGCVTYKVVPIDNNSNSVAISKLSGPHLCVFHEGWNYNTAAYASGLFRLFILVDVDNFCIHHNVKTILGYLVEITANNQRGFAHSP